MVVLVPLAAGFEEIEAVVVVDVLRRAGLEVVVVGDGGIVVGAHGIGVRVDRGWGEVELGLVDVLVLPGGMPGTRGLMADERVVGLVRRLHGEGKWVAAVCAAPLVLMKAGVIEGGGVAAHPSVHAELGARVDVKARVVRGERVITGAGAGVAMEFALAIVGELCGEAKRRELARAMLVE